jgi:hypothetical protein
MTTTYLLPHTGSRVTLSTDHAASSYGVPVIVEADGSAKGIGDLSEDGRAATWHLAALEPNHEAAMLRAAWEAELMRHDVGILPIDTYAPCAEWRQVRNREIYGEG